MWKRSVVSETSFVNRKEQRSEPGLFQDLFWRAAWLTWGLGSRQGRRGEGGSLGAARGGWGQQRGQSSHPGRSGGGRQGRGRVGAGGERRVGRGELGGASRRSCKLSCRERQGRRLLRAPQSKRKRELCLGRWAPWWPLSGRCSTSAPSCWVPSPFSSLLISSKDGAQRTTRQVPYPCPSWATSSIWTLSSLT